MAIEPGDRVWLDYIATLPNGAVFDTSVRSVAEEEGLVGSPAGEGRTFEPLEVVVGEDGPFGDLADGLVGMEEGDVDTAHAELADERVAEYDREEFEAMVGAEPEVGHHVEAADGATGTVTTVDGETVAVDFSHALAGEPLEVKLRVVRVESD